MDSGNSGSIIVFLLKNIKEGMPIDFNDVSYAKLYAAVVEHRYCLQERLPCAHLNEKIEQYSADLRDSLKLLESSPLNHEHIPDPANLVPQETVTAQTVTAPPAASVITSSAAASNSKLDMLMAMDDPVATSPEPHDKTVDSESMTRDF